MSSSEGGKAEDRHIAQMAALCLASDSEDGNCEHNAGSENVHWEMNAEKLGAQHIFEKGDFSFDIHAAPADAKMSRSARSLKKSAKKAGSKAYKLTRAEQKRAVEERARRARDDAGREYMKEQIEEVRSEYERVNRARGQETMKGEDLLQAIERADTMEEKLTLSLELKNVRVSEQDMLETEIEKLRVLTSLTSDRSFMGSSQAAMVKMTESAIAADAAHGAVHRQMRSVGAVEHNGYEPLPKNLEVEVDSRKLSALSRAYKAKERVRFDVPMGKLDHLTIYAKPAQSNAHLYRICTVLNDHSSSPVLLATVDTHTGHAKAQKGWASHVSAQGHSSELQTKAARYAYTLAQKAAAAAMSS